MSRTSFLAVLFLAIFLGVFFFEALQEYPKVDIIFLQLAPNSFLDMKAKTRGFVKYYHGPLMIDFPPTGDSYLVPMLSSSKQLNSLSDFNFGVRVMLNGVPSPPEGSYIEVSGTIKWVKMWRGYFFYVHSWRYSTIGIEIISDTATLFVIFALLLLLFALGKLVYSVLMHKRLKKALSSENYGFEYD
jgi:hypothetical protein